MRTLLEIIEAAKDGQMPTHEECYWALLALEALHGFDSRALLEMPENAKGMGAEGLALWLDITSSESFNRFKAALNRPPKAWLGPANDPSNPECQRRRELGKRLLDKITV